MITLRIKNGETSRYFEFETEDEFQKINKQIVETLEDTTNSKGVIIDKSDETLIFPSLYLKNSLITVSKNQNNQTVFSF